MVRLASQYIDRNCRLIILGVLSPGLPVQKLRAMADEAIE
jgi:hypothetical protein